MGNAEILQMELPSNTVNQKTTTYWAFETDTMLHYAVYIQKYDQLAVMFYPSWLVLTIKAINEPLGPGGVFPRFPYSTLFLALNPSHQISALNNNASCLLKLPVVKMGTEVPRKHVLTTIHRQTT